MDRKQLIQRLFEINGVKVGRFALKSGQISPFYVDFRLLVSYPDIMEAVSEMLYSLIDETVKFDVICGVPYTALPIATCMSISHKKPMVMRRKEAKNYGTKQTIEGVYRMGQKALVVEDVLTSGTSILETAIALKNAGLEVTDALVLLDREQEGPQNLSLQGIKVHSVLTMSRVMKELLDDKKLAADVVEQVIGWIHANPSVIESNVLNEFSMSAKLEKRLSFNERAKRCTNAFTIKLLGLVEEKKSNLCVAVDFTSSQKILELVDLIGEHISVLKLHVDIIEDFSFEKFVTPLQGLAKKHRFLIFEDRKFADIGNTVSQQISSGLYRLSLWTDLVNAHIIAGPGVIQGLKKGCEAKKTQACLLVAEMSSKGNLMTKGYSQAAYSLAKENADFVVGFICQSLITREPHLLHFTPGVHLGSKDDPMGQQYSTPEEAVSRGADIVIVGRGVTSADDPKAAAQLYQQRSFQAYAQQLV